MDLVQQIFQEYESRSALLFHELGNALMKAYFVPLFGKFLIRDVSLLTVASDDLGEIRKVA